MPETIEITANDLGLEADEHYCYRMSETALADWLRPEEDEAWAYLQKTQ